MLFLQRKAGRAFEIRSYNFVQKGEHAARNFLSFTSGRSHGELLRAWDAPYALPFRCVGNLDRVMRLRPASVHQTRAISSVLLMCSFLKFDGLAKSPPSRHPGESRGPQVLGIPGFRLPPEWQKRASSDFLRGHQISLRKFSVSFWTCLVRTENPGPLGLVRGGSAMPLGVFKKSRWRSHESGVKPGPLAPDSPIQAISLLSTGCCTDNEMRMRGWRTVPPLFRSMPH